MKKLLVSVLASLTLIGAGPVIDQAVSPTPTAEAACSYHHWYSNVERWHSTAITAGWSECQWQNLSYIIYRESRGKQYVWNHGDCCGGSIGLMQINGTHWNWLMRAGVIRYPWDLTNAYRNLRAAKALYNRAGGWGPWR